MKWTSEDMNMSLPEWMDEAFWIAVGVPFLILIAGALAQDIAKVDFNIEHWFLGIPLVLSTLTFVLTNLFGGSSNVSKGASTAWIVGISLLLLWQVRMEQRFHSSSKEGPDIAQVLIFGLVPALGMLGASIYWLRTG